MDIEADYYETPMPAEIGAPSHADPNAWLTYFARITDAEHQELRDHSWLLGMVEHFGHGPIAIPERVANDPRLTVFERFVLAALLEVSVDVDVTTPEVAKAVCRRLFGALDNYHPRIVVPALTSLLAKQVLFPSARGGFVLEGA